MFAPHELQRVSNEENRRKTKPVSNVNAAQNKIEILIELCVNIKAPGIGLFVLLPSTYI